MLGECRAHTELLGQAEERREDPAPAPLLLPWGGKKGNRRVHPKDLSRATQPALWKQCKTELGSPDPTLPSVRKSVSRVPRRVLSFGSLCLSEFFF